MVHQMAESPLMSSSGLGSTESIGEAAIVLISIGSILIILCAAAIIYGLRRRRNVSATRQCRKNLFLRGTHKGIPSLTEKGIYNPTDFMHSLATWDRTHSIDEMLEKRRRSAWTLEIFENYNSSEAKNARKLHSET